ncbi:MAG: flagellar hook-basal body protein [Phycisphaerales bacterium]
MNYGLYMAASGTLANLHRMDVISNNLANTETPGFKPMVASLRQREAARIEDGLTTLPSNALLERLGAGVMIMPHALSMAQGAPERTSRPLDVAVSGPGFLVVQPRGGAGNGESPDAVQLTRDGRLTLDKTGRLVHQATGHPVLDEANRPIEVSADEPVTISRDGAVRQGERTVAKLQVVTVENPARLRPLGNGLLGAAPTVMAKRRAVPATLIAGSYERSAVDAVRTMTELSSAERAVGATLKLIQYQDQMMDRAINGLGRVA